MKRESLSSIIRSYRKSKKLSQEAFAGLCDISKAEISLLEKGRNPVTWEIIKPKMETYEKLAHGMRMSRDELISRVEGKSMFEKVVIKSLAYSVPIIRDKSDIWCRNDDFNQLEQVKVPEDMYKKDNTVAFRIIDDRLAPVVILVNLGQRSYNSRTTFPKYTDSIPISSGQRILSQRDKLAS